MSEGRARRYIFNVKEAIKSIDFEELSRRYPSLNIKGLLDAIKRYTEDAEYYLSLGDYETAIAAASYAEGLLDSLKYLGLAEPKWPGGLVEEKRVFVGGTFDLIHPGHIELLRYASTLGRLYVVVARDVNVARLKGRKPVLDESSRLQVISAIRYVYRAFLGDESDIFKSVEQVKPDVIVLGPDQPFDEEYVVREAERRLGYRPQIIRFNVKREFSEGLRGSRDIIKLICESSVCKSLTQHTPQ